jgi:hypothetical protein
MTSNPASDGIAPPPLLDWLDGDANCLKGGRTYVHGTDILPAIERIAVAKGYLHVPSIEFHNQLVRVGVVFTGKSRDTLDPATIASTGFLALPGGGTVPFTVMASPVPIAGRRGFDETAILARSRFDPQNSHCSVSLDGHHSLMEHVSSAMKNLCQHLSPDTARWWFVRFRKDRPLPEKASQAVVRLKRNTLGKFIAASVEADGEALGTIEFMGGEK